MKRIIIIGGGAAGIMSAAGAAENGADVLLLEKNAQLGKKLLLTGGGRCNITNTADAQGIIDATLRNPSFLYSALYSFDSAALRDFLHGIGLATKVGDAGRVFPTSEDAADVVRVFVHYLKKLGVQCITNAAVADVLQCDSGGFNVALADGRQFTADAVIIATGGLAAPHTGSDGDGYRFARDFGHGVTKLFPSLMPLLVQNIDTAALAGLSLIDIGLIAKCDDKIVYKDSGDVIFTHNGISGPLILRASAHLAKKLHISHEIYLDLAQNKTDKALDDEILSMFAQNPNRNVKNILAQLIPARLAAFIGGEAKAQDITKDQRKKIVQNIKAFRLQIAGGAGFGGAVITCGGINCDEINPGTMESKLVSGLYFAGELLDVDALTGGYNLTIAFATGRLAGLAASGVDN